MSKKAIILDNSFTDYNVTKLNPSVEEKIYSKYVLNLNFINPNIIIEEINKIEKTENSSDNVEIFELESLQKFLNHFPNNRYMNSYLKELIDYFAQLEEYEKCALISNFLIDYFSTMPSTKEEIISHSLEMVESILMQQQIDKTTVAGNPKVMALNIYEKVGRTCIYGWALWNETLPLTNYFIEKDILYPQLMVLEILEDLSKEVIKKYSNV